MGKFDRAIYFVLMAEGGFSDDQDDHGGTTKFGISFSFLKQLPTEKMKEYGLNYTDDDHLKQLIHDMDVETAKKIYLHELWEDKYEQINSEILAINYFDALVLSGAAQATKMIQRACWAYSGNNKTLKDDGVFGPKTLTAINHYSNWLLPAFRAERAGFYRLLCAKNSSQEKYLKSWLNRVYR